ncbi:hypothetical protein TKK_0008222 [Trichogramma kaykai]
MENTKLLKKKKVRLSRAQREKKKAQAIQNDLKKGLRILQPHEKLKFANMHHKDEAIKIKRAKLTLAENARRDAQRRNALERRKKLLPPNGAENTNSNINKSPTKQPKDLENQIPGSVSDNEVDDEGIDPFKRSSKLNRSIQDDSPTSSLKRVEAYADLSKEGGPVITKTEETPENSTSVAQQQEQEQHQPSPKLPDDPQIPNNQNIALINQRDPAVIIMAEQVKVKDAIATVPLFNGKNMNVEDFLETVTEAHDLIDQVKRPIFLKLVKLKIQGEARKSLKGATLNSVDELKKHLKQLYGTGLSLTALQGLLSRQIQQNGESVLTFANKIRDIGNEIIQKKEAEGALPPTFEASVKASQIECFKNGLIDEIALRLTNNDDISAIITEAVKIEKDLEIKRGRINVNADCLSRNVPESQRDTAVCVVTRSTTEKTKILTDNSQTNITTSAETKSPPINEKGKPSKKLQKPKTPIPTRDKSKRQTKRTQRFDPSVYSKPPEPDPKSFKIPNSEPENSEESDEESQIEDEEEIKQIEETVIQEHSTDNSMVYSKTLMHCIDGNIAYFIDINGQPIDDGAKKLKEFNKLPKFSNISVGDASLFELSKRINHFALCIKDEKNIAPSTCKDNMKVALSKLRNLLEQRTIKMIFLTKSENILGLPWSEVITSIVEIFKQTDIKIVICTGKLTYIPEAKRDEIFDEMHNSAIGGHRGISKTYNRIKRLYYWENLKSDIQRRIQQCLNCQLKKLVRLKTRQPMIISDTPGVPFEKVALDIVGPMTKSKDGFEYILTIQDNFSKFCMAIPLIDISAISVMDAFIKRFVSVFGSPKVILTDQAYHPQSNGSLERSHHVLKEYLKQYSMSDDSWADWVELAILNYNTSVQESTKLTPYEIIFGRLADLPSAQPLRENDLHPTYQDYLKNLVSRLNGIQKIAYDNLVASKFKNKKYYDAKVNYKEFKPGDYVFLLSGSNSKKANQYQGPFKILEVLKSNNIRLQIKKKSKIVHANRIRISHIN